MNNFDEFWAKYPGKKVAKPKCKLKYDKLSDDEHKKVMLAIRLSRDTGQPLQSRMNLWLSGAIRRRLLISNAGMTRLKAMPS